MLLEALNSGLKLQEVFAIPDLWNQERKILRELEQQGVFVNVIPPVLLKQISDLETPPGLLAVALRPERHLLFAPARYGAFLISIRDPGNVGTIFRSAEAAGCEFVAFTRDCADPFQPKVVRASMGSVLRIPLIELSDAGSSCRKFKELGVTLYALMPRAATSLFEVKPDFPAVVLIGSESRGLPDSLPVDREISIPMKKDVESLNAAMAATLCFYHFSYGL